MDIKELADIGARAACHTNGAKLYGNLCVNSNKSAYCDDAIHREAFAQAVIDAYLKDDDMLKKRVHELMAELVLWKDRTERQCQRAEAAESRLAALEWRPVSIKPTDADADSQGRIIYTDGKEITYHCNHDLAVKCFSHWRPAALPPVVDKEREAFEAFWNDETIARGNADKEYAFGIWQAARKQSK